MPALATGTLIGRVARIESFVLFREMQKGRFGYAKFYSNCLQYLTVLHFYLSLIYLKYFSFFTIIYLVFVYSTVSENIKQTPESVSWNIVLPLVLLTTLTFASWTTSFRKIKYATYTVRKTFLAVGRKVL